MTGKKAIKVRPATLEDLAPILAMIQELAAFEGKDAGKFDEACLLRFGFCENPYFWLMAAVDQDDLVLGYALYYYTFRPSEAAPILYLEDLYVKEQFRGQGAGSKLMAALAQKTKAECCCYMEWNVFSWNKKAIEFYVDRLKGDYRQDLSPIRLSGKALVELGRSEFARNDLSTHCELT